MVGCSTRIEARSPVGMLAERSDIAASKPRIKRPLKVARIVFAIGRAKWRATKRRCSGRQTFVASGSGATTKPPRRVDLHAASEARYRHTEKGRQCAAAKARRYWQSQGSSQAIGESAPETRTARCCKPTQKAVPRIIRSCGYCRARALSSGGRSPSSGFSPRVKFQPRHTVSIFRPTTTRRTSTDGHKKPTDQPKPRQADLPAPRTARSSRSRTSPPPTPTCATAASRSIARRPSSRRTR